MKTRNLLVLFCLLLSLVYFYMKTRGPQWRSGRASDSESRVPGFDPHKRHRVVSLSKTH